MTYTSDERQVRIQKRQELKDMGIVPYVQKRHKESNIAELIEKANAGNLRSIEEILQAPQKNSVTAGRLILKRISGKLSFAQIIDETAQIQLMFEHQGTKLLTQPTIDPSTIMGESTKSFDYWFLDKYIDAGDIIGVKGELFHTHKGELTIFVSEYQLLSKALRPLGDKFHGLGENTENAYRQRYLDMIHNREALDRMKLRFQFMKVIRDFYHENGFLEIETPALGNSASGAAAAPFVTHHNDFDIDMYLRISPETNLKKATVGMLEKVFEVAKDFRNEGSDPSHHQEFTMIEHYAAYRNHEDNMAFTEQMFDYVFSKLPQLKKEINVPDKEGNMRTVNFTTPWPRIDYVEQILKDSGIDVSQYEAKDEDTLRADILAKGHKREGIEKQATATMIDYLYKKVTRPKIGGPAFIVNYPKTMQPLARVSDRDPKIVEQRQLLINGREVIKAYCELVDPIQQQLNFDEQASAAAAGDEETTSGDPDFVLAMEYGMPPQSGRGMGIDRIFALLTEQSNIRDVILFPMMKPENKEIQE
ncbi:MAG: lysine--tRNA ligase [Candidatus Absconditabacterales bacterium]